MDTGEIALVRESWAVVKPISEKAAELFYGKLFELNPEFKSLFKGDMTEQGRKLMAMINTAVNSLDKLDTVLSNIQDLGRRHVDYGVKPEDYAVVAQALLWTLGQGLGDKFTPEVEAAWTKAYTVLAETMIDATK
jgi:hemoglobin-like flavoprotein